ncbi:F-box protein At4g22280-like [Trifolium pratense]|uniref:F-box protein At4g22280-like n=1 Tax=Trifolium pratense TaxID=57577 RepID=UPI001E690700|nr:F-box protein At4g22280-like [Trifolium pratense]
MSDSEIVVPPAMKRIKLNDSENKDRLSHLPDSVIIHILSFLNTKLAVQTCILSKKWKHFWKHLPNITLHYADFGAYEKFARLVSKILSLRDSSISLQAFDFKHSNDRVEPELEKILNYAISHNVERLGLDFYGDIGQIPSSMFSCWTLTHLKLFIHNGGSGRETLFPKSVDLPALTNLQLGNFAFGVYDNDRAEPFSTFKRLNSLLISNCIVSGFPKILCVSSVTLVNLTLYNQIYNSYKIDLCTPSLCKFGFIGTPYQKLSGSNVSSLKHVDIDADIFSHSEGPPLFLFSWLLEFVNIESLMVTATTLQILSIFPNVLKNRLPSLRKLKSLKVKMEELSDKFRMTLRSVQLRKAMSLREADRIEKAFKAGLIPSSPVPDGIVNFLLQNSPLAKVDFIECSRQPGEERSL